MMIKFKPCISSCICMTVSLQVQVHRRWESLLIMADLFFDSISQKVWVFSFIHILDTASTDGCET